MAPLYSGIPVNHDSVTVSRHLQYQDLKQLNGIHPWFILLFTPLPFYCDMSKCLWKEELTIALARNFFCWHLRANLSLQFAWPAYFWPIEGNKRRHIGFKPRPSVPRHCAAHIFVSVWLLEAGIWVFPYATPPPPSSLIVMWQHMISQLNWESGRCAHVCVCPHWRDKLIIDWSSVDRRDISQSHCSLKERITVSLSVSAAVSSLWKIFYYLVWVVFSFIHNIFEHKKKKKKTLL